VIPDASVARTPRRTLTLPNMSFLTGAKATDPRTSVSAVRPARYHVPCYLTLHRSHAPKIVVRDSAASRNSLVEMALFFSASIGTSVKDFLKVSRKVPPGGIGVEMVISVSGVWRLATFGGSIAVGEGGREAVKRAPMSYRTPGFTGSSSCPAACSQREEGYVTRTSHVM